MEPPPAPSPKTAFNNFLQKATGVLQNFGIGEQLKFPGKDGDMLYSKNNVCVHPALQDEQLHHPGYLTIHCQTDEALGVTLVLQWMPNATLQRNPRSIQTISPRPQHTQRVKVRPRRRDSSEDSDAPDSQDDSKPQSPVEIKVSMNGDELTVTATSRPASLPTASLPVPSINVIPQTPVTPHAEPLGEEGQAEGGDKDDGSSTPTSGADDDVSSVSTGSFGPTPVATPSAAVSSMVLSALQSSEFLEKSPEEFAESHDLMLPDGAVTSEEADAGVTKSRPTKTPALFSVDLGKMRTLRLFYSDPEAGAGQMVIASQEGRYKILHFHFGGLDKVSSILEQWSAVRSRSTKGTPASPDPMPNQQFRVCRGSVGKAEEHPEEGLYEPVSADFWRASTAEDGSVQEPARLRKAIFFAGVEEGLRKEAWPFLLSLFPWDSTAADRERIRHDLYLQYQKVRGRRAERAAEVGQEAWAAVEGAIRKDVVRTDRRHPYYAGEGNPNTEVMHQILLSYAAFCPPIGYIQGMSDLLAPLLAVLDSESDAFWAFAALMQRSIFVSLPKSNTMERNLEFLGELLKLLCADFHAHLQRLGGDAPSLMFAHRWILLCFKREFSLGDGLALWEACWSGWGGDFFHLFVACGIVSVYGGDVVSQALPHDEILLYLASLAGHMDAGLVFRKARGLLHAFHRLPSLPCTLAPLRHGLAQAHHDWDGAAHTQIHCVLYHGDDQCPHQTS